MKNPSFAILFLVILMSPAVYAQSLNLNAEVLPLIQKISENPDDVQSQLQLAYLYSEGREHQRALEIYESVLQKYPENKVALNEVCYLYTFIHNKEKAYNACQNLTKKMSESYLSFDNLGLSYYSFGDIFWAIPQFDKAQLMAPEAMVVKNHWGMTLLALKDYELARDYFTRVLAIDNVTSEDKAFFYYGLYEAEKALKNWPQAFEAIWQTYQLSQNPLYLGRVVKTFMKWHEVWFFFGVGFILLGLSQYFGKRLNRFLRNEA